VKKDIFLTVFLLFIAVHIGAQESERQIGVGLGHAFSGYREETFLPLGRTYNSLTLVLNGNIEKGGFLHSFNLGFFRGKRPIAASPVSERHTQPDVISPYFEFHQINNVFNRFFLEYALDKRLWGSETLPGYLGGAIRGDGYIIETLNNTLYLNYTGIISINLHASQKWIINEKNNLIFSASAPLFGYALRPSYVGFSSWPLETGIVSIHNYQAIYGDLKYNHKISSLLSLQAGLGFELSRINFPRPRRDASFRTSGGITFTL
jgi:hypothetical protein